MFTLPKHERPSSRIDERCGARKQGALRSRLGRAWLVLSPVTGGYILAGTDECGWSILGRIPRPFDLGHCLDCSQDPGTRNKSIELFRTVAGIQTSLVDRIQKRSQIRCGQSGTGASQGGLFWRTLSIQSQSSGGTIFPRSTEPYMFGLQPSPCSYPRGAWTPQGRNRLFEGGSAEGWADALDCCYICLFSEPGRLSEMGISEAKLVTKTTSPAPHIFRRIYGQTLGTRDPLGLPIRFAFSDEDLTRHLWSDAARNKKRNRSGSPGLLAECDPPPPGSDSGPI